MISWLYPKRGKTGVDCSIIIAVRTLSFFFGKKTPQNCQQLFVGGYGRSELCSAGKGRHKMTNDPLQQRQEAMFRSAGQPGTRRAQLHLCWTVPLFLTLRWLLDSTPPCLGIPVKCFCLKMSHNPPSHMGWVMGMRPGIMGPEWENCDQVFHAWICAWTPVQVASICMWVNVWRHTESPNSHTNK